MIQLKDVSFSYDGKPVLNNLCLSFEKGSFIGITGENGSGKTTLLRLMAGLGRPQKGSIDLGKGCVVSYVRQTTSGEEGNFPASVREIVALGAVTNQTIFLPRGLDRRLRDILGETGLQGQENSLFASLSGGQKQRVKIAKALIRNPDILLLDEPTSGLDEKGREDFLALLSALKNEGKTIVMVSHRKDDFQSASAIYHLINGRLFKEQKNAGL